MKINIENKRQKPLTWSDADPGDLMFCGDTVVLRTGGAGSAIGIILSPAVSCGWPWCQTDATIDRIIPSADLVLSLRKEIPR